MRVEPEPGSGWERAHEGATTLIAAAGWLESLRASGLHRVATWDRLIAATPTSAGRGGTAVIDVSGRRLRIKRLRRGGLLRGLWRDRFFGRGRLFDNLRLPHVAIARGVATPAAVGLLIVQGPFGLFRGWLALEEIEQAVTLGERLADIRSVEADELDVAMRAIRQLHDAGIDHRDLNLGNVLLRRAESGEWLGHVIDLDRARLHASAVGLGPRRRSLRRLERSYAKRFGSRGALGAADWTVLRHVYARGDARLGERLVRWRQLDRLGIAAHRLGGWR